MEVDTRKNINLETFPVGAPFVLNPLLPKDADILLVSIDNHHVKVSLGSEHLQEVVVEERVCYII